MPEDNHYSETIMQVSMDISNIMRLSLPVYSGWQRSEILYEAFSADIQDSVSGLACQK
jgi:hypothetical protein